MMATYFLALVIQGGCRSQRHRDTSGESLRDGGRCRPEWVHSTTHLPFGATRREVMLWQCAKQQARRLPNGFWVRFRP